MDFDTKQTFSSGEKVVIAGCVTAGNIIDGTSRLLHLRNYHTLREYVTSAQIQVDKLNQNVKKLLDHRVSQVCRSGSRFTKDCICVQLYDDGIGVLRWAMQHGALICIARYQVDDYPCIVVDDPASVYADMCRFGMRNNLTIPVAICGSIGKTTAKKMIYSVYRTQFKTFCDAGNDNQLDGVGYISQHIPLSNKVWVQEVSEDTPGNITNISKVVRPHIAVITAIERSHIEMFGDEQGILNEIHSITDYMPEDAVCITSIDEDNTRNLIDNRKVISVSLNNNEADYSATNIQILGDGLHFSIKEKSTGRLYNLSLRNVFAVHNIYAALYAFACGVESGVTYDNIAKGIEAYRASGVRQNIYRDKGAIIYADCYNAVAKSVRSAVKACDEIPVSGKRIAVIGDIAEQGDFSDETHEELIRIVNDSKMDVLLAYGKNTCKAARSANNRNSLNIVCCDTREKLNREIKKIVKKGDLILFKASHSTGLEKSLMKCFPLSYIGNVIDYYWPQITWRIKVLTN